MKKIKIITLYNGIRDTPVYIAKVKTLWGWIVEKQCYLSGIGTKTMYKKENWIDYFKNKFDAGELIITEETIFRKNYVI